MSREQKIRQAREVLVDLGLPKGQQNDRSALCLLALLNLTPQKPWSLSETPLVGITPMMDWARTEYKRDYKWGSRETVRRQTMHQFVQGGLALYNPDKPDRPVNSPHAVYQVSPDLLAVLRSYGTSRYRALLKKFLANKPTLASIYAKGREMAMVPLVIEGQQITLSPGKHSELIKQIVEEFAPRFAPGGTLIYVGDTGAKHGFFNVEMFRSLEVHLDHHGKLPDVVVYDSGKNWLFLIESVTSHGPVDGKRQQELQTLFEGCSAGLVFVSAFPNRRTFLKYLDVIAWETEVWFADAPTHMIHFDGSRFLGPYQK